MKALIVCLSSDLPHSTNRDCNTMYFVYDRQVLYDGQSPYSSTFSIVPEMPSEPAIDRFFIDTSDGLVKMYSDYQIKEYAQVATDAMLDVLKQAGTIHFFTSKHQYIDSQTRMLSVPFTDGAYQLVVDIPNDLLFNEKTILKFNPEKGGFEIYGETLDEDPLENNGWHGHRTETVITKVEDGRIKAKIRISQSDGNIIKVLDDGLYAYPSNTLSYEEFESWKKSYDDYKGLINYYIQNIQQLLADVEGMITEDVIDQKIHDALEDVIPELDTAIQNFDVLAEHLDEVYEFAHQYADETINAAIEDIDAALNEAFAEPWADFPEPETDPDPEDPDDPEPSPEPSEDESEETP